MANSKSAKFINNNAALVSGQAPRATHQGGHRFSIVDGGPHINLAHNQSA